MQNDLVREFSMQCNHGRFIITANGFFNIDLDLLGSMFITCLAYLVILIQFETSNKEIQTLATES